MDSFVEQALKDILGFLGVSYESISKTEIAGQNIFSIEAKEAGPILIGAHGDTIHALDFLIKRIVEKKLSEDSSRDMLSEEPHFLIDVNGYRTQKVKDLQSKALVMAERARSLQYDVELSPMSGYERLIVHTTLQGAPNVKTESQGEGRSRRVVIKYSGSH